MELSKSICSNIKYIRSTTKNVYVLLASGTRKTRFYVGVLHVPVPHGFHFFLNFFKRIRFLQYCFYFIIYLI